ncbi:cache domain-containing protein [Hyphomicrobium sp.]|uniref:cache domain-containing protein n=1 Tax=Hyphomicrobium sp. TaxID=82 RepID=UPI002E30ADD5|nr:cache domain-containing protein [Hyphomicrobium sp.]HEX2840151.1 cache domain-containing protein [Hyphomicrobium sp.]
MKNIKTLLILMLVVPAMALASTPLFAELKHASKEDAQAMAIKAADFLKKEGPDKAIAAFNGGGDWRSGDLYVFVFDKTGTWKASGARPELIGKNDLNTPDPSGKLYVKEIVAINKDGWVDYKFKSPADNQIHEKKSYVVRVGDLLVGAGAYKY